MDRANDGGDPVQLDLLGIGTWHLLRGWQHGDTWRGDLARRGDVDDENHADERRAGKRLLVARAAIVLRRGAVGYRTRHYNVTRWCDVDCTHGACGGTSSSERVLVAPARTLLCRGEHRHGKPRHHVARRRDVDEPDERRQQQLERRLLGTGASTFLRCGSVGPCRVVCDDIARRHHLDRTHGTRQHLGSGVLGA